MDTPSGDRLRLKDLIGRPVLERSIAASKLLRLAQLATLERAAQVTVLVVTDASGRHWLEGTASIALASECQRCLEPVQSTVSSQFRLWLLGSKAEARLKTSNLEVLQEHDVRLIVDGMIDLVALVEDELLLELPGQPCQDSSCPRMPELSYPADAGSRAERGAQQESRTQGESQTRRPFAGLKELLNGSPDDRADD
ncbi:MAG: YceD family protein [Pseudomonadales bacterium]